MLMVGLALIIIGIFVPSFKQARPQLRTRLRTESMSPRAGAEMMGKKKFWGPELPEVAEEEKKPEEARAAGAPAAAVEEELVLAVAVDASRIV